MKSGSQERTVHTARVTVHSPEDLQTKVERTAEALCAAVRPLFLASVIAPIVGSGIGDTNRKLTKLATDPLLLLLTRVVCTLTLLIHSRAGASTPSLDEAAIVAFLKRPPALQSYSYEKTLRFRGIEKRHSIRGRWRGDDACWTAILGAAGHIQIMRGKVGSLTWEYNGETLTEYDRTLNRKPSNVAMLGDVAAQDAHFLVRFGLQEVSFPTAKWTGSRFQSVATIDIYGTEIAVEGGVGRISDSDFELRLTNSISHRLYACSRLSYTPQAAWGLAYPKTIEITRYDPVGRAAVTLGEVTLNVIQVVFETNDVPDHFFFPTNAIGATPKSVVVISNDAETAFIRGRKVGILSAEEYARSQLGGTGGPWRRRVLAAALIASGLVGLILVATSWWTRRGQTNQEKQDSNRRKGKTDETNK